MLGEVNKVFVDDMREKEIVDNPICEHCGEECCVGYDDVVYISQTEEFYCHIDCYLDMLGAIMI